MPELKSAAGDNISLYVWPSGKTKHKRDKENRSHTHVFVVFFCVFDLV